MAYRGRVERINGLWSASSNGDSSRPILQDWAMHQANLSRPPLLIETLALLADMQIDQFVDRHTMVPLQGSHFWTRGQATSARSALQGALRPFRSGAYFCPKCVNEDIKQRGFAHWRRSHQIPGLSWCIKHQEALWVVNVPRAFYWPLSQIASEGSPIESEFVKKTRDVPAIAHFVEIETYLLEHPTQRPSSGIWGPLQTIACSGGYSFGWLSSSSKLFSDRLLQVYPFEWLCTVISNFNSKVQGQPFSPIDLPNSRYPITNYIAVLCAFVDDSSAALEALMQSGKDEPARPARAPARASDYRSLSRAYVKCHGNCANVARMLGLHEAYTRRALGRIGLPSLNSGARIVQLRTALDEFIVKRSTLGSASRTASLPVNQLESLLRETARNLLDNLNAMIDPPVRGGALLPTAPTSGKARAIKRTRGNSPSPNAKPRKS